MTETNRLANASISSLFVHGLLIIIAYALELIPNFEGIRNYQRTRDLIDNSMEVEQISQEQLQKYRRLGKKGGQKNFTIPVKRGNTAKKIENKRFADGGALSFRSLQTKIDKKTLKEISEKSKTQEAKDREKERELTQKMAEDKQKESILKKEVKAAESGIPLTSLRSTQTMANFQRQRNLQNQMMSQLGTQTSRNEILKRTGFNLHMEPPEGVTEDELNSMEKIFFSFQKRTFLGYINAFLSTYNQKILSVPQLQTVLRSEKHLLTGKIEFDKEGNILRIKILRSSHNDEVHDLFEKTLRQIRSLPNPPKAMIKDREQFTIYYQLRIN